MLWMPLPGGGGTAEAPPAPVDGVPDSTGGAGPSEQAPIASPEYGESPGADMGGFSSPSDYGSFDNGGGGGQGFEDVMQDPWASQAPSGGDGEGGGWWGTIGDLLGGGNE